MPEPVITDPNNPNPTAPDATKPNGSSETGTIDFSKLTDEQLAQVYENPNLYKHPRFKELSDKAKRAKELEEAHTKAEEDKLLAQKKFEDLYTSEKQKRLDLEGKVTQSRIDNTIERIANKSGVVDTEAVLKLLDRSTISVDETTGEIKGVDEAVKKLLEEKKYLAGKVGDVSIGSPTNPGAPNTTLKRFKLSQLQDAAFYQANEKDIRASMAAHLVEDDMNQGR